jgi:cob(I)alamin adenosyltransferase
MVVLSKIYTKTGDSGETGLGDGSRVSKTSRRIAAIGAVDETNSAIGVARLDAEDDADTMLSRIQNDLFDLGADLSAPEDGRKAEGRLRVSGAQVERLEREIDAMNEALSPLTSFVLPGGTALAAHLHLARAGRKPPLSHWRPRKRSTTRRCVTPTDCQIICLLWPAPPMTAAWATCCGFREITADYSGPSRRPKTNARITPSTPVAAQPGSARAE